MKADTDQRDARHADDEVELDHDPLVHDALDQIRHRRSGLALGLHGRPRLSAPGYARVPPRRVAGRTSRRNRGRAPPPA